MKFKEALEYTEDETINTFWRKLMKKIKKLFIKIVFTPIWLMTIIIFIGLILTWLFDKYFSIAFDTEPNFQPNWKTDIKDGIKEIFKYWII